MRFDDSLDTVLSADMSTPFGAQSAWRQLVDLIGRRRVPADARAIARLKAIRADVPPPVRAASARALAFANPPAALVRLFFDDEIAIAAPVLRVAGLRSDEWIEMLPGMSPAARSVLRHRRDLPADVHRALEAFGSTDFRLTSDVAVPVAPIQESPPHDAVTAFPPIDEAAKAGEPETFGYADNAATVPDILPQADQRALAIAEPAPESEPEAITDPIMPVMTEELAEPPEPIVTGWSQILPTDGRFSLAAMDVTASNPAAHPIADAPAEQPLTITPHLELEADSAQPNRGDPIAIDQAELMSNDAANMSESAAVETQIEIGAETETETETETVSDILLSPVDAGDAASVSPSLTFVPPIASPFVSVGAVAMGLPVVAEALRRAEQDQAEAAVPSAEPLEGAASAAESDPAPAGEPAPILELAPLADPVAQGAFQIAELVARIDAYQRRRDDPPGVPLLRSVDDSQPALFDFAPTQAESFRFETDAAGIVRWIEGAARAPLIGMSLKLSSTPGRSQVDGVAAGAFRHRTGFADARLVVEGSSDAAGQWRITGVPAFDRETGRFTGYRGTARRPRADESAEPARPPRAPGADALRQLVHELRTPTNAIAGFAEMIESQLLGPVPGPYRDQAAAIRSQAAGLLGAIDDIDLAARIESHALDLRSEVVMLGAVLVRAAEDLRPLAAVRCTDVVIDPGEPGLAVAGDERAVERLIGRLLSTLVASGSPGERLIIVASRAANAQVTLVMDRPRTLAAFGGETILTIDAEAVAEAEGAPLLGTGFALRLARNLADELGGTLTIDDHSLTLALPAATVAIAEQASHS